MKKKIQNKINKKMKTSYCKAVKHHLNKEIFFNWMETIIITELRINLQIAASLYSIKNKLNKRLMTII